MSDIIFICNANMCRSVFAEYRLRRYCKEADCSATIASMGIHAKEGRSATEKTVQVSEEYSLDVNSHTSRPLIPGELKLSRLILTMEAVQLDFIDIFFPQVSDRLFMLSAWPSRKDKRKGIADPVGRSVEAHRKAFKIIDDYIQSMVPDILTMFQ